MVTILLLLTSFALLQTKGNRFPLPVSILDGLYDGASSEEEKEGRESEVVAIEDPRAAALAAITSYDKEHDLRTSLMQTLEIN